LERSLELLLHLTKIVLKKWSSLENERCPPSSVAQRYLMNHHTRHLGGLKTWAMDDYWVK
jgi:hypothetical protein